MMGVFAILLATMPLLALGLNFTQYRGEQVFQLHGAAAAITQMHTDLELVDFWHREHVRVTPTNRAEIMSYMSRHNITYSIHVADVEQHFIESMVPSTAAAGLGFDDFFNAYHNYADILAYMAGLQKQYNGDHGLVVSINTLPDKTYLGNTISYMTLTGQGGTANKKWVLWEGTIHAREWIATSTMVFAMSQLLELYAEDPIVTSLLDQLVFVIVPVVNVDGFLYTWSTDRMWRKTRSVNPKSTCIGTDPNRNWDTEGWGTIGGSTNPCSETYFGPTPFSEGCVVAMRNFILANPAIVQFVDWHTYGSMFFCPYGYTCALPPPADYLIQYEIVESVATTIEAVYRNPWTYGTICNTIYAVGGGSTDWTYLEQPKLLMSFGAELAGTSFSPPARTILTAGIETFEGMKLLATYALNK